MKNSTRRTILRKTQTYDVVSFTESQYNLYKFAGLNDSENYTTVDQYSFADANNVYVDGEDRLTTRPAMKQTTQLDSIVIQPFSVDDITDVQHANNQTFYIINNKEVHWKYDNRWWSVSYNNAFDHVTIVNYDDYYLIFTETGDVIDLKAARYDFDEDAFKYYDANELIYLPLTEIHYGATINENAESKNVLTDAHRIQYVFNKDIHTPSSSLEGQLVEITIGDNTYSLIWDESYTDLVVKYLGIIRDSEATIDVDNCKVNDDGLMFITVHNKNNEFEYALYSYDASTWGKITPPILHAPKYVTCDISRTGSTVWLFEMYMTNDDPDDENGDGNLESYLPLYYIYITPGTTANRGTWTTLKVPLARDEYGYVRVQFNAMDDPNNKNTTDDLIDEVHIVEQSAEYNATGSWSHYVALDSCEDGVCAILFPIHLYYKYGNHIYESLHSTSSPTTSYTYDINTTSMTMFSKSQYRLVLAICDNYTITSSHNYDEDPLDLANNIKLSYQKTNSTVNYVSIYTLNDDFAETNGDAGIVVYVAALNTNYEVIYNMTEYMGEYSTVYGWRVTDAYKNAFIYSFYSYVSDSTNSGHYGNVVYKHSNSYAINSNRIDDTLYNVIVTSRGTDIAEDVIYYVNFKPTINITDSQQIEMDAMSGTLYADADYSFKTDPVININEDSISTSEKIIKIYEDNSVCTTKQMRVNSYDQESVYVITEYYTFIEDIYHEYLFHDEVIPVGVTIDGDFYYIVGNEVYTTNFTDDWYINISKIDEDNTIIIPSFLDDFITHTFVYDNVLYQMNNKDMENGEGLLYIPEDSKVTFPDKITGTVVFSQTSLALFIQNTAYEYAYDSENDVYRLYPTKLQLGNREDYDMCVAFDGLTIYLATVFGYKSLTYEDFIQSTEQAFTDCCKDIYSIYTKFDDSPIKQCKYNYWIFLYKQNSKEVLVYDTRYDYTNYYDMQYPKWFKWTLAYCPVRMWYEGTTFFIWCDNNKLYTMDFTSNDVCDVSDGYDIPIEWFIKSQRLHFSQPAYYKHINALTILTAQASDMRYNLQLLNYHNDYDTDYSDTADYKIETVGVCVKKVNFMKTQSFQYIISNDPTDDFPKKFTISGITIKYRVTERVR